MNTRHVHPNGLCSEVAILGDNFWTVGGEKLTCDNFLIMPTFISPQVLYLAWWPLVRDSLFYLLSLVILMLVLMDNIVVW